MSRIKGRYYIGSFYDLTEEQQKEQLSLYDNDAVEDSYFINDDTGDCISMVMFMLSPNSRYDAVMGLTNTSALGCIFSASGDEALIVLLY